MNLKTLTLGLAVPFFWGTTFTLAKPVVAHFPPLFLMLMAYSFVALVLLFNTSVKVKTPALQVFVIALFAVTLQGAGVFGGLKGLDATTANLVLQMQVPAAVLLGWLLNGEQLTRQKLLGTTIAVLGVIIVIGLPEHKPPLWPTVLVTAGGTIWAFGQVLAQKYSRDAGMGMLKANAIAGVPQLALATWLLETGQWQSLTTATPLQWLQLGFVILFGFYFAYASWFALLKRVPMNVAAPFVLLMTPIGLVTAVVALGETMSPAQIAGGSVLLLGLAMVNGLSLRNLKLRSAT